MTWPLMTHGRVRRVIERAFVSRVNPRTWRRVRAHMATCDRCRDHFERLSAGARALSGSDLDGTMLERVGEAVLTPHRRPARTRRAGWFAAGLSAVAAAAVVMLVLLGTRAGDPDTRSGFTPRGSLDAGVWDPGERKPGVRLFCIEPRAEGARVVDEIRAVEHMAISSELRCILGGEVQVVYSTPGSKEVYMVIFSRDDVGVTHYYAPLTGDAPAMALAANVIDEPLEWSTRLKARHAPGRYELHVRFTDRPLPAARVAASSAEVIYELHARMNITTHNEEDAP